MERLHVAIHIIAKSQTDATVTIASCCLTNAECAEVQEKCHRYQYSHAGRVDEIYGNSDSR